LLGSRYGVGTERDNQHEQNGNGLHDHLLSGCNATRFSPDFTLPAAPAGQNRMGKVAGADGGQRQLHSEAGSEQNRGIESDSNAAAAIFAPFHCTSCPSFSDQMLRCRWMTGESPNLLQEDV
jgi:hypothetical protein